MTQSREDHGETLQGSQQVSQVVSRGQEVCSMHDGESVFEVVERVVSLVILVDQSLGEQDQAGFINLVHLQVVDRTL